MHSARVSSEEDHTIFSVIHDEESFRRISIFHIRCYSHYLMSVSDNFMIQTLLNNTLEIFVNINIPIIYLVAI